jgi:hypothetical protein
MKCVDSAAARDLRVRKKEATRETSLKYKFKLKLLKGQSHEKETVLTN